MKLQESIWDNVPKHLREDVNLIKASEVILRRMRTELRRQYYAANVV